MQLRPRERVRPHPQVPLRSAPLQSALHLLPRRGFHASGHWLSFSRPAGPFDSVPTAGGDRMRVAPEGWRSECSPATGGDFPPAIGGQQGAGLR